MNYKTRVIETAVAPSDAEGVAPETRPISTDRSVIYSEVLLDREWVRRAFLVSETQIEDNFDRLNLYRSTASDKYIDSTLGGSIGINPKPQYTMYSDIPVKGRKAGRVEVGLNRTSGSYGPGRYWSEAHDDPAQKIYLRFGVPEFNALSTFLTLAFNPTQMTLARTGRFQQSVFTFFKALGMMAVTAAFPIASGAILIGRWIDRIFTRPTSKYYTLKPTMHNYWMTVNTLVNTLAVNRGLFPFTEGGAINFNDPNAPGQQHRPNGHFVVDQDYIRLLAEEFPDIFSTSGFFDILAVANKAQRLAIKVMDEQFEQMNSEVNYEGYARKEITGDGTHATILQNPKGKPTFAATMDRLFRLSEWRADISSVTGVMKGEDVRSVNPRVDENGNINRDFWRDYTEYFDAEFRDGASFAIFRVEHTGTMTDNFGNSAVESEISQTLNSTSSEARQMRFSLAEGNIIGGSIGSMIGGVMETIGTAAKGLASGLTLGLADGLIGLAGNGYVDIPKHWQSSSASIARSTYTIKLISPYGNPISQIMNIDIPLCMLLAGTLPLSTGKQSYTSPFLCQLFDRGRCQIKLGIIESLSISRGITNLNFTKNAKMNGVEVSFTVLDLSSILHMPITNTGPFSQFLSATVGQLPVGQELFGREDMALDEDNILMDYLAVLAGQDLYTQIYPMAKARLNLAKRFLRFSAVTRPSYWASLTHDTMTVGALEFMQMGNILQGAARGGAAVSSAYG